MSRSTRSATGLRSTAPLMTVALILLSLGGLGVRALIQPSSARTGALTNDGSITALGATLTENFDTLPSSGSPTWANNSTIAGWYHARTGAGATIVANDGASNAGNLYSYGASGDTDRALGSVGSGNAAVGDLFWGVRLQNNTGFTITSLNVSYTGEQWRNSGAPAQTVSFSYLVGGPTVTGSLAEFQSAGVAVPSLDFTSPVTGGTAGALNGNLAANRVNLSFTITGLSIPNGTEIMLRWSDPDHDSSDHGLAIDDLSVTAFGDVGPTPTPTITPTPTPTVTPTPTPTPTPMPNPAGSGIVVISQVYGGGGNTGSTLKNDFIEIINHTDTAVDLSGWSVQYASATDQNWQVTPLTSFMLQPGQYYLIQEAAGAGGTDDLPPADATGVIPVGSTAGKIALVSSTVALTGLCPSDPAIVDFVGYGGANCFEGSAAAPLLTNTTAALRGLNGCLDTNNNAGDFAAGGPAPRNSSSSTNNCAILSGIGSASPRSVQAGDITTLTVRVFPAPNPPSTGISVVGDLSSIGGSPNQPFSGAGNIFTFNAIIGAGTSGGMKSLPVTITDDQGRSFSAGIPLNVRVPHVVISQVYGGGGNNGATFTNDYVELYNPTNATVTITGWSLQYTSSAGTAWTNNQPIGGTIAPGEYYLVSLASGGDDGSPLPVAPNISGGINMAAGSGKIALVSNSAPLSGACPIDSDTDIVDFVGYGTAANCNEGGATAPQLNNTTAIFRINNGQTDTDQNGADFIAATPGPRRTAPIVELGPWVASTDPITNGTNTPYDATVTVDFSEPVNVAGAWYGITCSSTGQRNNATVAPYNGSRGYHITPNTGFQFGETCTVTIFKDQVRDQDLDDSMPDTDTLFENYTWSFTVIGAGAPAPYPPGVHLAMGNPSNATPSVTDPNNFLMEKPAYSLSYNRDKGTPNWVSWHLDQSWIGTLARVDTFRADPAVPPDWYRVQSTDYTGSGFDRGHMAPNADRDNQNRTPINQETFLMTNMVPQAPENNQGPWAAFENYLREQLALNGGQEMYIVSGPLGAGGSGSGGGTTITIAGGRVTVPAFTWKVVLVLPQGDNDLSRISCSSRTIAVLMPNTQGIANVPWENYLTTVDEIEALTGYDLFSNLPEAVQFCLEAGSNGDNPPGTANQSAGTPEDAPVMITLRAALPNNNTPTFSIVGGGPAHGSLGAVGAVSCTGGNCTANVAYTPGLDYNGGDSFNFKVNDGNADSNVSTVSVNVAAVNDPPAAAGDARPAIQDTALSFPAGDLAANDAAGPANESGQALTVTGVNATAETHGTVTLSGGVVTYSPAATYSGPASFEYQVCDNGVTGGAPDSRCAVAGVNLFVALNSLVGLEGVTLSGAAYADSYDSSGGYPATKGSLANILSNGTITIAGGGQVKGNARSTHAGVDMSGAGRVTGNATAGTTVSRSGGATVGGTITNNAMIPPMAMPAVPACGPAYSSGSGISGTYSYNAGTGDLTLNGIDTATLANGTYCFHNVTLSNSAQLKVIGPVVIRLTGKLDIGGAGRLNNMTGDPGDLLILSSCGADEGITIKNGANTHMMVYAPQTGVSISGAAPLFGGVVGRTVTVGNSGTIHYDTRLRTIWPEIWSLISGPLP